MRSAHVESTIAVDYRLDIAGQGVGWGRRAIDRPFFMCPNLPIRSIRRAGHGKLTFRRRGNSGTTPRHFAAARALRRRPTGGNASPGSVAGMPVAARPLGPERLPKVREPESGGLILVGESTDEAFSSADVSLGHGVGARLDRHCPSPAAERRARIGSSLAPAVVGAGRAASAQRRPAKPCESVADRRTSCRRRSRRGPRWSAKPSTTRRPPPPRSHRRPPDPIYSGCNRPARQRPTRRGRSGHPGPPAAGRRPRRSRTSVDTPAGPKLAATATDVVSAAIERRAANDCHRDDRPPRSGGRKARAVRVASVCPRKPIPREPQRPVTPRWRSLRPGHRNRKLKRGRFRHQQRQRESQRLRYWLPPCGEVRRGNRPAGQRSSLKARKRPS